MAKTKDIERDSAVRKGQEAINKLGAFHGIPIGVADQVFQKGKFSMFGLAHLCEDLVNEDAPILKQFLQAGAIPLVKGNVSQCDTSIHSNNAVFGESVNPHNFTRAISGDAGLVSAKCVPFCISTDQGLSMRIPSAFGGVFCFKPT